jgi:hypothetical protein
MDAMTNEEKVIQPIPENCDRRELVEHVNEIGRQVEEVKAVVLALASSHTQLLQIVQRLVNAIDAAQKPDSEFLS